MLLGEVSLESGNCVTINSYCREIIVTINNYIVVRSLLLFIDQFERAIDDFTSCLKIRELVLKADDRLLAEVLVYNWSF